MTIRNAGLSDIPVIRSVAYGTWPAAYGQILSPAQMAYMLDLMYSETSLIEQMTVKSHLFLIIELDGVAVGFAGFEHHLRGTNRSRLHKLYVMPDRQGSGAGKELLSAAEFASRKAGDVFLELNVNKYNRSKHFYLRHGYVIERDEVLDIGAGYVMDDHVLIKAL